MSYTFQSSDVDLQKAAEQLVEGAASLDWL
jgi:hypothetical protein